MSRIAEVVNSFLENYGLKDLNYPLCLGFSGGYDSMCLLHLINSLGINVIAVHLNHNWRGDESKKDEDNCRKFCEINNIKFYSETLSSDIPKNETAARTARYDFFQRCLKKYKSKVFLTAHNADDNAETVLYRIVKGTGVDGLAGIRPKRDCYYRPLLSIRRYEIEEYCRKFNLVPNIDSSNIDIKYKRNLIRHKIIPLLADINPDVIAAVNSLSELALEDSRLLDCENTNSTDEFLNLPNPIQSRIIKNLLISRSIDYGRERIELIIDFILANRNSGSGKTFSIGSDLWLFVNSKYFEIIGLETKNMEEILITSEGIYDFGNYCFILEKCTEIPKKFPDDSEYIAYVKLNKLNYTLRTRRDGDIISPLGMSGTQKLKKFLNSKKIPSYLKDTIPLLCEGSNILWVAGVGLSNKIRIVDNKVSHVLKLMKKDG